MAIPINLLTDRLSNYQSKIDFHALRNPIAVPMKYTLFLTNTCNMLCDMCTQRHVTANNAAYMEECIWTKLLNETSWTYPRYVLFGGEPLMHPQFKEIVMEIINRDCNVDVVTNGMLLNKFVDCIADKHVSLFISMSGCEKTHNKIKHNGRSFEEIRLSIEKIQKTDSRFLENNVSVNCVLLPDNINDISSFVKVIQDWGIRKLTLQHPQWTCHQMRLFTNEEWKERLGVEYSLVEEMNKTYLFDKAYLRRYMEIKKKILNETKDIDIHFFPDFKDEELDLYYDDKQVFFMQNDNACLVPWLSPIIDVNGDIKSCVDYAVGNIMVDKFWHCWNGTKNQVFRNSLMECSSFPVCKRCCLNYEHFI